MYYDGTKLLSLKDAEGNTPEIFICTTNRTGGKTTYFNRLMVNRWIKYNKKFCLIYRYKYELDNIADKFFKDIKPLFFPEYNLTAQNRANGVYQELFIQKNGSSLIESCGYAIALNAADQIKKHSHLLNDTDSLLFDEFQPEDGKYCSNEIAKFRSIHTSLARGRGKQVKYLPVYMISNPITLLNPYYVEFGITERINPQTKFLRGIGWVMEQGFNESAANAQKESGFNRAFQNDNYLCYESGSEYLLDNNAFIEQPKGQSRYLCTLRYNGSDYAIREFPEAGYIYCDDRPDKTYKYKLAVTTDDHQINYVMLKRSELFLCNMRFFFEKGAFRFKDLRCKQAVLKALSY